MVGHDRVARLEGRTKFRSVDLHSQHDYMWLGCRSLLSEQEVGPRTASRPLDTKEDTGRRSGLFDLHSQHDYMRLGCRGLCQRTEEVGP